MRIAQQITAYPPLRQRKLYRPLV